jgi:aspartate racemase
VSDRKEITPRAGSPTLGLVVGLGLGAGVYYYRHLAKALEAQGTVAKVVLVHADLKTVLEFLHRGEIAALANYLNESIETLASAGATTAAISAVTPHACIDTLARLVPIPLVSILDSIKAELLECGATRVALFGTRYVIESDLFGALSDIDVVRPSDEEITLIGDIYKGLALRGHGTPDDIEMLTRIGVAICDRERVEKIVLAGTDLSMLFESEAPRFPAIDSSEAHLRTLVELMR